MKYTKSAGLRFLLLIGSHTATEYAELAFATLIFTRTT